MNSSDPSHGNNDPTAISTAWYVIAQGTSRRRCAGRNR